MPELITIPAAELAELKERLSRLAREKAQLQLIALLMNRLSELPGLEKTVEGMLQFVMEILGGLNVTIFYRLDDTIHCVDVHGRKEVVGEIEDVLVRQVFETRELVSREREFSQTGMLTKGFTKATTFVMPLLVGAELVGVLRMDDVLVTRGELRDEVQTFLRYVSLVLKNEISGETRLRRAFDEVGRANRAEAALAAQHSTLRGIIEGSTSPIFSLDREYRYVAFNRSHASAMRALYGAEIEVGRSIFDYQTVTEDREKAKKNLDRALAGEHLVESAYSGEEQRTRTYFEVSHHPVRADDGMVIGAAVFANDITERKRAEEERLNTLGFFESMDRVNRAMQGTNDLEQMMSDVLDAVLTSFDCDRAFLVYPCDPETTSYRVPMERTRPEFPGALARGLEVPVDPESARVFRAARASSGPVTFDPGSEPPLPTYLTERFRVQSQLAMAVYPKVAKPYMFGLHQCSNPRIWTADEKSLFQAIGWRLADGLTSLLAYRDVRESEERYRRIVDTAAEGIWVLGPDTMTTFVNARMAEMLAYSDEEMIGRPTTDFMFEDDAADHLRMMENRRHGLSETYERRFRRKDGATVWTMASGTPAFDDEHRFGGTFAMFTDITERKRAEEALRKSEERLRLEVARMPIAYIVWDTDFRVVTWNPAAERIFGFTFDEARGRHPYGMIVPPEAQPHVDDIWNRLLEGDASAHSVNENTTKDGRTIVCDWTNTPLKHPDGAVLGVMSMVQDITERVRAEEEIVRVNRALCMLSDTNQALIHITDEAALLNEVCRIAVDVGGSLMAWVGFAEHDEAKTLRPVAYAGGDAEYVESARVSWADDERGRGPGGTAVRTGRPSIFHSLSTDPAFAPWREAAIQRGYRSIVSLPLISEAQTLGALLIYAGEEDAFDSREVEILEELADDLAFGLTALRTRARRDEAEEALHKREAELNESQRLAHIGSFDWDAVKDTIWWSAEYFRIYGLDPGRPAADYVGHLDAYTAESAQRLDAVVKRTMETGEPYEVDLELAHPTASTRWIVARGEAKRDAEGRISGIRGTAQNITEHMRLEGDLRQSQKMDAVGRLAGGVAHDFNNLLTAILGYGHLLDARLAESGAGREEVTEILQAGERAAVLTRQLLAFSRKQVLAPVVFRVNDLIADFEKMLRRMIGEDITLVTRLGSDANHVLADPGQIEQVLMNLAVNARDAMPRGGTLTIETEGAEVEPDVSGAPSAISPGRYVVITVRDTGTGMDAATQARIFEPFFTTKEKGKGTGLGLSTVYGIVKQSNGAIQVSSKPGEGSTFRVYLPQAGDATPRAFSRSSDSTPAFGTETILVVDDEPSVGGVTRRALERYGYRVLLVSSGAEALELARKAEPIHLLLTDVVMPGMSGTALAGQLKELRPDLRLLFMSGYAADETALSGAALDNFIQKPFTPESLARRVREILSADRSSEAPA